MTYKTVLNQTLLVLWIAALLAVASLVP